MMLIWSVFYLIILAFMMIITEARCWSERRMGYSEALRDVAKRIQTHESCEAVVELLDREPTRIPTPLAARLLIKCSLIGR